jgi:aspartyl-tRNA(Asn)/glutamyl-tRNA(Gln) amidotransferase subunit B
MQEGSLRCDANVNLHVPQPDGTKIATPIVEIKNLNSFRFTEQAVLFEVDRQWREYQRTKLTIKDAPKATRGYDPERGVTYPMREKEEAADYRYFPDPDLLPVTITHAEIGAFRATMSETPAAMRTRFQQEYQLSAYDTAVLIAQGKPFAKYFEAVAKACGDGKQAANWMTQDVLRELKERQQTLAEFAIPQDVLAALLSRVLKKQLTIKSAREVFLDLLQDHTTPTVARIDEIVAAKGLAIVQDDGAIEAAITAVLARHEKAVADYRSGKQAAIGALIGQVMRELKGADAQLVRDKLTAALQTGSP